MAQHYHRNATITNRRKSVGGSVLNHEQEDIETGRRLSISLNSARRLSTISQIQSIEASKYHPQPHIPPSGIEGQQTIFFQDFQTDDQQPPIATVVNQRRLSIISRLYEDALANDEEEEKSYKSKRNLLFILEPILSGLLVFPILVLFWECGWNLILILLNVLNQFSPALHLTEEDLDSFESYTWQSLVIPYLIGQLILLIYYLTQEYVYKFLDKQYWLIKWILLKVHILILAFSYIIQWEMLWTIWDQFTPADWYFELTLSFASLFALIVFIGHLADLICSPFIYSYDSIDYCVYFGCPLLTKNMKTWKINLINYILYEFFISNLSIMTWRGFYHYLDNYLYPDDVNKSAGICLAIGYLLYFPLMYFQTYLEELSLKYEFWTFIQINFPQFYRNIRHLLAFLSCLFGWRGWWMFYDHYIYFYEEYFINYLIFFLVSYLVLCFIQTASSTNGPLSHIDDEYGFFPLYPHCYISIMQNKIAQLFPHHQQQQQQQEKV